MTRKEIAEELKDICSRYRCYDYFEDDDCIKIIVPGVNCVSGMDIENLILNKKDKRMSSGKGGDFRDYYKAWMEAVE